MKKNSIIYYLLFIILFFVFLILLLKNDLSALTIIAFLFLIFGIIEIKYYSIGYLFSLTALFVILFNNGFILFSRDITSIFIVELFCLIPTFFLLCQLNDKYRIIRKGGIYIKAKVCDYDSKINFNSRKRKISYTPIYQYYYNDIKYVAHSIFYNSYKITDEKDIEIDILIDPNNPNKCYVNIPKKILRSYYIFSLFLIIIGILSFISFVAAK